MRPSRGLAPLLCCALIAACGGNVPTSPGAGSGPAPTATVAQSAPPAGPTNRGPDKPSAPIDLIMTARPLAGAGSMDRFEVVLTAKPRRDLERVELAIDGRAAQTATATAGSISEARATVEIAHGSGKDVVGTAVVIVDGKRMGAAAMVRVGAPSPEQRGTIIYLPDGTPVEEVRP